MNLIKRVIVSLMCIIVAFSSIIAVTSCEGLDGFLNDGPITVYRL